MKRRLDELKMIVLTCAIMMYSSYGSANNLPELLFFPYITGGYFSGLPADSTRDSAEDDFGVDIFATMESGKLVVLAETLVSKKDQHIERLQIGMKVGNSTAWLGRFHNPIGYWNSQFHHGAYLQTTVSRPFVVEFEHDGGILPTHLTGLLIEGIRESGNSGLGYALAVAAGPELGDHHLEEVDILNPGETSSGLVLTAKLFRQPVTYDPTEYGLFMSRAEIPASGRIIDEVRQTVGGGYWHQESDAWRLVSSIFYVRNKLIQTGTRQTDAFVAGYFQAERLLSDTWSVFGRVEKKSAGSNDPYLALFPHHTQEKLMAGIRMNLFERHAFSLEISSDRQDNDHHRRFLLQWTAVF
jgi:hypothetical protein